MRSPASPFNTPPNLSSHSCLGHQRPKLLLPSFTIPSKLTVCGVFCSHSLGSPPDSGSERNLDPISLSRSIIDWPDEIKERGMRKRRLLYNHDNWQAHRSSLRHVRHLRSSLTSRVILSLVPPVLVFTAFAAALVTYNTASAAQWLPGPFPVLSASSLPYQLTAAGFQDGGVVFEVRGGEEGLGAGDGGDGGFFSGRDGCSGGGGGFGLEEGAVKLRYGFSCDAEG